MLKNILKKKSRVIMIPILISALSVSCNSKDENDQTSLLLGAAALLQNIPNTKLKISASSAMHTTSTTVWNRLFHEIFSSSLYALDIGSGVTITDFQIALEEIQFGSEDDGNDDDGTMEETEVSYTGPFVLDLIDASGNPTSITLDSITTPPDTYDKMEFSLHCATENLNATDPLYGRSIYLKGTYNGTPLVIYDTIEKEIEVSGANGFDVDSGLSQTLILEFKLGSLLNGISTTALDNAVQTNGTIYIGPDSNSAISAQIRTNLQSVLDFGEDDDDDGAISEVEDID